MEALFHASSVFSHRCRSPRCETILTIFSILIPLPHDIPAQATVVYPLPFPMGPVPMPLRSFSTGTPDDAAIQLYPSQLPTETLLIQDGHQKLPLLISNSPTTVQLPPIMTGESRSPMPKCPRVYTPSAHDPAPSRLDNHVYSPPQHPWGTRSHPFPSKGNSDL